MREAVFHIWETPLLSFSLISVTLMSLYLRFADELCEDFVR